MAGAPGYVKSIWQANRWVALAPPGGQAALGDVFKMTHGVPMRMFNLADKGIEFRKLKDRTEDAWTAQASTGVTFRAKIKGKGIRGLKLAVLGIDDVGAVVELTDENAFVMSLSKVRFDVIRDITAIEKQISEGFFWTWDWSWLIVTELATAAQGTFLSAGASKTTLELKAKAGLKLPARISAGDISAAFSLVSHTESTEMFVARRGVTPLFRAVKWRPVVGVGGGSPRKLAPEDTFAAPYGPGAPAGDSMSGRFEDYDASEDL